MALDLQPPDGRKRVKVYELRQNDWFDRGTGFCTGHISGVCDNLALSLPCITFSVARSSFVDAPTSRSRDLLIAWRAESSNRRQPEDEIPRIYVESEDEPIRVLLESKITKEDGYQKQQETLIVWTESDGTDMALSFQEAEGCAVIWDFVHSVQQQLLSVAAADDALSDDLDNYQPIQLQAPELGNLADIEQIVRAASMTQAGRDALSKFVIRDEYIGKLVPLVTMAEDLESLVDLHRLCNIMKSLILLNDNTIIETVVADQIILGVVGALEYDPEFPTHKANHRQYLADQSRYKEVVPIKDPLIRRKIRSTWRLQYLKDVVLARILDDPTFSVLNSLIFFNQMEIVNHIQSNAPFLRELFSVFDPRYNDNKRKDDAVQFLHQCAAIAKNLQAPSRAQLFANFISHGLFAVIAFAVKHTKAAMRTTGIDILMALLDHDPVMMRGYMLKAVNEKKTPLTDTLIDLLHAETDLGVKNQLADAIKILLDPQIPMPESLGRAGPDFFKLRSSNLLSDAFVQQHFDDSSKRLFQPLKHIANRMSLNELTFQEVTLYSHLVDILTFFVRQHLFRTRNVIHSESLAPRVAQLLTVPQKHLKLVSLKFFRTLISLQDTFYQALMTHNNTFGLILDIVCETMPRDNLLNSACLELFEFIKRENIKPFILHVVEKYRDKLDQITYVDTFRNLILRYDQMQGNGADADATLFSQDENAPQRLPLSGQRWQGVKEMDAAEEEYFNASDDEDEWTQESRAAVAETAVANGSASPVVKPLVDYPDDDEDEDAMDTKPEAAAAAVGSMETPFPQVEETAVPPSPEASSVSEPSSPASQKPSAPERLAEKRRREEEDEDELVKLAAGPKRRSSLSSNSGSTVMNRKKTLSIGSIGSVDKAGAQGVMGTVMSSAPPKRIAINIGPVKSASPDSAPCEEVVPDAGSEKENQDEQKSETTS
ncbi:hypothetical protein N7539_000243 [Penicillium diatomitis]|uniref:Serine/threonine-protein phosphatase 4 regulatory subunit 3-like central domain-containing protein n=1 Tax=Penicillium diatomitis TaxID=2819901 RepID=A0A9X0C226_9EURO|nr:uncharacterized protein N7539_000243 [Penicillium diatomitis]KAJ5495127.1 hypothetical protein N7539_000243 [Penicillium diatomitis]